MTRLLFVILLCNSFVSDNKCQTYISTQSGQRIAINNTGQWTLVETADKDILSSSTSASKDILTAVQNISNSPLTVEEISMYNQLLEQLKYYEADYYIKYLSIKSPQIGVLYRNPKKESLKTLLFEKYNKSFQLLKKLSRFKRSTLVERQDILIQVKSETYKELKLSASQIDQFIEELNLQILPPEFDIETKDYTEVLFDQGCQLIFNGFDNRINKKRKEVKSDKWFGYTHPKLFNHFKDKDFLNAIAAMMEVDGKIFLNLKLVLATRDARRSYGYVDGEALLRITLVNGDRVYLQNQLRSEGILEAYTGNTVYQCLYPVDKDDIKELTKTEIDRVGIMWTSGFEEYEIYNVDFVMNQLACLNGKK